MAVYQDTSISPQRVKLTTERGQDVVRADGSIRVAASDPVQVVMLNGTTAATTSPRLDRGTYRGPAALVIANIGGATPTETIDLQGSVDGAVWYNVAYALVATPNTVAVAQITVTATATTTYLLLTDQAWRYLRIVTATITNEQTWVTYYQ